MRTCGLLRQTRAASLLWRRVSSRSTSAGSFGSGVRDDGGRRHRVTAQPHPQPIAALSESQTPTEQEARSPAVNSSAAGREALSSSARMPARRPRVEAPFLADPLGYVLMKDHERHTTQRMKNGLLDLSPADGAGDLPDPVPPVYSPISQALVDIVSTQLPAPTKPPPTEPPRRPKATSSPDTVSSHEAHHTWPSDSRNSLGLTNGVIYTLQKRYNVQQAQNEAFEASRVWWWSSELNKIYALLPSDLRRTSDVDAAPEIGVDDLRARWEGRQDCNVPSMWERVMLTALERHPAQAHMILAALAPTVPCSFMVEDVVHLLIKWQLRHRRPTSRLQPYADFLGKLLRDTVLRFAPARLAHFHGLGIRSVYHHCSLDVALALHTALYDHMIHVSPYRTSILISRMVEWPEHRDQAIRDLAGLCRDPRQKNDAWWPIVASITTRVLTQYALENSQARTVSRAKGPADAGSREDRITQMAALMNKLTEHGLSLNLIHYTAWIRNMCLEGAPDMALQAVESLLEQNLTMDKHVYSILFNGAKEQHAFGVMERSLELASQQDLMGTVLWNDMLHAVFAYWNTEQNLAKKALWRTYQRPPCFPYMYWYYRRVFTTSPLERIAGQELPMLDPRGASTELMEVLFSLLDRFLVDRQPDDKVEPDTDTLVVMLIALIKDTNSMDNVFVFFTRFCRMLGQGDPLVCRLVREQTTRVYNAVIKRVAEFKGTIALRICRSIVYHMLQDQIGRPGGGEEGRRIEDGSVAEPSPEPQRHPAPDVRTWSILMHGYFGNGNVREANEILTLMRRHRVKPNLETWNTLAGGHSFHQDYEATVSTVRRIHEKGLQPDEYTNKSVLRLNDHPRALQMLRDDAAREESEADERAAEPATPGKSSGTPSEDERLQMELDYLSGLHAPGREM